MEIHVYLLLWYFLVRYMSPNNCGKKFYVSMLVWQQTKTVLLNSILTCLILELTINYALTEYSNVNASPHAFLDI